MARHRGLSGSDISMPVMHGLQLLRAVRAGTKNIDRATPFALLTGHSDKELVDLAICLDANAFLVKPVSRDGIGNRLSQLINQLDSGSWLKEAGLYGAIDVDDALAEISGRQPDPSPPPRPFVTSRDEEKSRKTIGVEVRGLSEEQEKIIGVEVRGLDETGATSSEREEQGRSCPLDSLPEKTVLARNIYTAEGALFLHAGTQLTPMLISVLHDLHAMGHPVGNIWIER